MKKKVVMWIIIVLAIAGLLFGLNRAGILEKKEPVYITAVMNGNYREGEQVSLNAIQMYINEANAEGGVNGHPIELEIEWLGDDPDNGVSVAEKIIRDNKAVAVLGNGYSDPAIAMGAVYAENKIPAITAGAGTPAVTEGNDWFFRVINNNSSQGKFIAEYARALLGYENAAIIYNNNQYGSSLGTAFEEAFTEQGGSILASDGVDNNLETLNADIKAIVDGYTEKPEMVFIATYRDSAAEAIIQLREKYPNLPILIGSEVANSSFAAQVAGVMGEKNTGGMLDGVQAASPLIFDVASEDAQIFQGNYQDKFKEVPTWYGATSYDSAKVVIEAMRTLGITGEPENLTRDRQRIRDYLESKASLDNSMEGITGKIFFNEDHNLEQPMAMGIFENDQFISASTQLYSISFSELPNDYRSRIEAGEIIRIRNRYFGKTRIVYVGIDVNEFDELDVDGEHTYLADFYLWFRYQGELLNYEDIKFDNMVGSSGLGDAIETKEFDNGTHYTLFKVRNTFRNSFNLRDYPFDKQLLIVKLRHTALERKDLIFVTDFLGLGDISAESIRNTLEQARAFETITDWKPTTGYFFADTVTDFGTRGDPTLFDNKSEIEHSRFNAGIEVRRNVVGFTSKTMMPVFWILVLAYLGLFLPGREFDTITGLMTGTVLSVVFFHVDLSGRLNVGYTVALDYAFYAIYALLATELFLSIIAWHKSSKNEEDKAIKFIFWSMRILYPAVFIGMIVLSIMHYDIAVSMPTIF